MEENGKNLWRRYQIIWTRTALGHLFWSRSLQPHLCVTAFTAVTTQRAAPKHWVQHQSGQGCKVFLQSPPVMNTHSQGQESLQLSGHQKYACCMMQFHCYCCSCPDVPSGLHNKRAISKTSLESGALYSWVSKALKKTKTKHSPPQKN